MFCIFLSRLYKPYIYDLSELYKGYIDSTRDLIPIILAFVVKSFHFSLYVFIFLGSFLINYNIF